MVQIFGNWGRIRTWIDKRIRIKDVGNTFVGEDAGKTTGSGSKNNFVGYQAGYSNITGPSNNFEGYQAGYSNTGGYANNFIGYQSGYSNTLGHSNSFIGPLAGYSNIDGESNNFIGYRAGYSNITGDNNCFIGYKAGYYETESNKLFIDNQIRTDEADARVKALIHGVFAATTANQRISLNARLLVREVPTYANDADAGTGGLTTGEMYKHADGSLHIKL